MRRLILVILALAQTSGAMARCLQFDFQAETANVPYIVLGQVADSNRDAVLSQDCTASPCLHRFTVETLEVLKGQPVNARLEFEYDYLAQRPEMALFEAGQKFVFAIKSIEPNGKASLVGTTCGRAGADPSQLDVLKKAIAGQ